jgi:hypothetical protein
MSGPVGSSTWFGEPGYNLNQSLRFEDGSSSYLSRTFASAGNRRTFTFSAWFKRGNVNSSGTRGVLFSAYEDSANYTYIGFDDGGGGYDRLRVYSLTSSSAVIDFESTAQLRDVSAWYHLVVSVDTTQGTSGNRVKIYLNGEQVTAWATSTEPSQNYDTFVNSTVLHSIGSFNNASSYFDGYMAEVNLVDGLAKAPADFGETGTFGEWIPIEYTGAYGTNGFYLPFNTTQGIIAAAGGSITTVGDYKVHSFTSDGTFTPSAVAAAGGFVEYLVVAGGGAAGRSWNWGGGGGAGGMRDGYLEVTAQEYTITVGAGGVKGTNGGNGGNSVFSSITSTGGGAGRSGYGGESPDYQSPTSGGSGGGSISGAGSGIAGQGFAGGNGAGGSNPHGGGGGGAGEPGSTDAIMDGGDGRPSFITGSSVTYAGGGAGSREDNAKGTGGTGGGGSNAAGTNGLGGGAGSAASDTNGGSGIVIIKYRFQ